MTTIVAHQGIVAWDSMFQNSTVKFRDPTQLKVIEKGGLLFGLCGSACMLQPMIEWYVGGRHNPYPASKDCGFYFMVFMPDRIEVYDETVHYPDTMPYPFAFGSGRDFALGAVHAGASAERACKIACGLDPGSTEPVMYARIPKFKQKATLNDQRQKPYPRAKSAGRRDRPK